MNSHWRSLELISAALQRLYRPGSWVASGRQKFTPNYSMFNFQVPWVAFLRHKSYSPGSFLGSLFLLRLKIYSKSPEPDQHPSVAGTSPMAQILFDRMRKKRNSSGAGFPRKASTLWTGQKALGLKADVLFLRYTDSVCPHTRFSQGWASQR